MTSSILRSLALLTLPVLLTAVVPAARAAADASPATAPATAPASASVPAPDAKQSAADVKREFLHAWRNYEQYAWGHDALKPLSRQPHDWYAKSLMMTPVDSLDTLIIMGLKADADKDRELIATQLSFDQDIDVKNFEVTIRLLGGLLSGYQLSGDARLLKLADDLGRRLLPAFETPTGMPYVYVNLRTGKAHGVESNPAETGSLLLEFGTLSKLTGNPVYYAKAKRALVETFKRRSAIGLVGDAINVETGQWLGTDASVASGTDSYYEYLWKCWQLFGDEDCLAMWKTSIGAINHYLADDIDGKLWYGHADMNTGRRTVTEYGALDAFFPAVLALSGDLDRAKRLHESNMRMWNLTGIEPELIDYRTMKIRQDGYQLRPEIIESNYYLWHYTDDPLYRRQARTMFDDFVRHCRTANGYAALSDVTRMVQSDSMESYVFAETFKYFYLTFAEPAAFDFSGIVFNTEAHPLRATWKQTKPAPVVATGQPSAHVNPLIGSRNGGNTFPGAVLPFGMLAWSPETSKGEHNKTAAPGGYEYDAPRVRGFSLTHLSGTGCRGASGDIPFMPITSAVSSSPAVDDKDLVYASTYSHAQEVATAGRYQVRLDNGVQVNLSATARTGAARFVYPATAAAATMLIRASDSEVGSSDAQVAIDAGNSSVSGAVTSGNFCGYLSNDLKRSYYTLYFVAEFDQPFSAHGTWHDGQVQPGLEHASGGTGYGAAGIPDLGHGSGAYVSFDAKTAATINVHVGISYVSVENARANLRLENPQRVNVDAVAQQAAAAWDAALGRIQVQGGSADQLSTFYTALYHALLHPNVYSDADGSYRGFDSKVHKVANGQQAQYANFSGWDIYRSQLQLVTWLDPRTGADIAQSLLNQATQNGGEWDRWTHNAGATHVMNGDPAAPAVAAIEAFGGTGFDTRGALDSLVRAATQPTANDRSSAGCPVACVGQRPVLDQWLKLHYIPANSNSWAGAAETLESASADFGIAMLAQRLGDTRTTAQFLKRADYWRNVFNPGASMDGQNSGAYIEDRNADGSWPASFDPAGDDGFVEGSAAQYLWMVPFNVRGLADALGGNARTNARLDAFFRHNDGSWALTRAGGLHSELDNEPSTGAPWLYNFTGQPYRTQETLREILDTLWKNQPEGIPGNDDLGAMSAWYVWSALGLYPELPGRAELLLSSPLFSRIDVHRPAGDLSIEVQRPDAGARYIQSLEVDGKAHSAAYLPEALALHGGHLLMRLGTQAQRNWGSAAADAPPSFAPPQN